MFRRTWIALLLPYAYTCSVQKETVEIPLDSWLTNENFNKKERIPWVTKKLRKKFSILREFSFTYWHHKMSVARIFSQFHSIVMQNFFYVLIEFLETNSYLTFLAVWRLELCLVCLIVCYIIAAHQNYEKNSQKCNSWCNIIHSSDNFLLG